MTPLVLGAQVWSRFGSPVEGRAFSSSPKKCGVICGVALPVVGIYVNEDNQLDDLNGGRSEIRTHGGLAPTAVFKTAALNHSAILPTDFIHYYLKTAATVPVCVPVWLQATLAFSCSSGVINAR
jgi:hypothetical protein